MRSLTLCSLLLVAASCGSSSEDLSLNVTWAATGTAAKTVDFECAVGVQACLHEVSG